MKITRKKQKDAPFYFEFETLPKYCNESNIITTSNEVTNLVSNPLSNA